MLVPPKTWLTEMPVSQSVRAEHFGKVGWQLLTRIH